MVQVEVITKSSQTTGIQAIETARIITTKDIIIHIFCNVDDQLSDAQKLPQAKLCPSEVVTIGILLALRAVTFGRFTGGYGAIL